MAQAIAEGVNVEQLCALLKGASAEQAQAAASALQKLLAEQENEIKASSTALQGQLAEQYSCDTHKRLALHAQFYKGEGKLYKFEGNGTGYRTGSGSDPLRDVCLPESVFQDTAHFLVLPALTAADEKGYLFFLNSWYFPLNHGVPLDFKSAPAFGAGKWSTTC